MLSYRTTVRRALNRARRVLPDRPVMARWPLAVAMTASLAVSAFGPSRPVHADPPPDPAARLQVIITSAHIFDDRDSIGSGELKLNVVFSGPTPDGPADSSGGLAGFDYAFSADSGDDVPLERVIPGEGEAVRGGASAEAGIPVYAGRHYDLFVEMADRDPFDTTDRMGSIVAHVDEEHHWAIGTYTVRSLHDDNSAGDFSLTFEIRRTPLPDLTVTAFSVVGTPGAESICGEIKNIGERAAGQTPLYISTEGKIVRSFLLPELAVGGTYPQCVERAALPALEHNLVFSLDQYRQIPEMDELNNVNFTTVKAVAGAASAPARPTSADPGPSASPEPKPQPSQGEAKADLTVGAVRINGRAPDNKAACTDGKNDLTVLVKNAGKGDAGGFTVRLTVDDDSHNAAVDALAAGQEREVHFTGISLKKGDHTLKASADSGQAIGESRDDNNELKVSVTCRGAA